ncbi:F-actin-capping protein subunit alpha-2-like [Sycon ciliatum]|uniref:F-actin-capping protein subunit alpha-2-like n=1 Tax=Sycon ciliatum TaxID=27933 RepID=UPI0020AD310D|eukprot:scpid5417/ scgid6486/ F-actin-capping protein subunit alpha
MADYDAPINDKEKVRIASNFILHAPPGEFNEVFNDVRIILNNDKLLKSGASESFAKHNMEQFVPVKLEGASSSTLITEHADAGKGRYFDPSTKKSFAFDHLRKEASDVKAGSGDSGSESFRSALESAWKDYVADHYPDGTGAVYGKSSGSQKTIVACIEDHRFRPNNFCNGRWRTEWTVSFSGSGSVELKGVMRVQVHYYEDGNVQLVSSKEVKESVTISDEASTAKAIVKIVSAAESDYQTGIGSNYTTMSSTSFKALRRALPVTRTKLDWNKIAGYQVAREMKK